MKSDEPVFYGKNTFHREVPVKIRFMMRARKNTFHREGTGKNTFHGEGA
jgi:hypothetical protein